MTLAKADFERLTHLAALVLVLTIAGCGNGSTGGGVTTPVPVPAAVLSSGTNTLTFPVNSSGTYGLQLKSSVASILSAASQTPVTIYVCQGTLSTGTQTGVCPATAQNSDPSSTGIFAGAYSSVTQGSATQVTAIATVQTTYGSTFGVTDVYTPTTTGAMTLARTVTVTGTGTGTTSDTGFNSQFSLAFTSPAAAITSYHLLAPSIVYDQNATAPTGAFATDLASSTTNWSYWRETRSAIPMLMLQDNATGSALSIARTGPINNGQLTASSGIDESNTAWVIDGSSQYGSLGIQKVAQSGQSNPQPTVGEIYPSFEGDINYNGGPYTWSRRSHPVVKGFSHSYAISFDLESYLNVSGTANFAAAAQATTHTYYNLLAPPIAADNADAIFAANINLNKSLFAQLGNGNGTTYPGLPFAASVTGAATLPNGNASPAYTYRLGFTGGQPSVGFQLQRYGALNGDSTALSEGLAILNFWSTQDPLQMAKNNNLPLTLFNPTKGGYQWQNLGCIVNASTGVNQAPVFIRDFADGMEDVVNASIFARQNSVVGPQKGWENFANLYGSWLLAHQDTSGTATNGSFQRWYDPTTGAACPGANAAGDYQTQSANATTFPMRFLVQMYFATGDVRYMAAARAAGAYVLPNLYNNFVFTGGILTDYEDRESGMQALHAALAMYDLEYQQDPNSTATTQWLAASKVAADYLETWQYAYNVQVQDATTDHSFAAYAASGSRAISLSTTGSINNSTGDIALSNESFDLFRMHLLADDNTGNYLHFSEQLEYNSKLTTQLASAGQNFGYAQDGFVTEAVTLTSMYFSPTNRTTPWLSWLARVELDPQQQLEDVFGNQSIAKLATLSLPTLQAQNHHIYPAPGSINWGK